MTAAVGPDHRGVTRSSAAEVGVIAVGVLTLAEILRVLFPLAYGVVGVDLTLVPIFLIPFLSPVLSPLASRIGPLRGLWLAVAVLVVGRLLIQATAPASLGIAVVALIAALWASPVLFAAVMARPGGAGRVAMGFLAGFGADAALKGLFAGWDRAWQSGWWPLSVTIGVLVLLLVCTGVAVSGGLRVAGEAGRGRGLRFFGLAVLVMPQVVILTAPAFLASAADVPLALATSVIAVAAAIGVALAGLSAPRVGRLHGLVAGLVVIAATTLVTLSAGLGGPTGVVPLAGVVLAQAALAVFLASLLAGEPTDHWRTGLLRSGSGLALGSLAMIVLVLLYPLHYEYPLPFDNALLPAAGVATAMLGLLARHRAKAARVPHADTPDDIRRGAVPDGDDGPLENVVADPPPATGAVAVAGSSGLVAAAGSVAGLGVVAAVALVLTTPSPPSPVQAEYPVRLASYNMGLGAGADGAIRFEDLAEDLAALDADVIAVQEVTRGWPLAAMSDFVAWWEHRTGERMQYSPAADRQFGNGLITRLPVTSWEPVVLPQGGGSMGRSMIVTEFDVGGQPLLVLSAHLQHRNTPASVQARADEIEVMLEVWDGRPRTVMMGDFNPRNEPDPAEPGGPVLLQSAEYPFDLQPLLDAGFTTTQPTVACTMPTSNENCSDYAFVTADLVQQPPVRTVPASVSDHEPILSEITPR